MIYRIQAADLKKATAWYTKILGKGPYFEEPFYVGFSVGGFELGLDPGEEKISAGNNIHAYWGVADIKKAVSLCLESGATLDSNIRDVGGEIKVATVRDPFGNILGLIHNPHFKVSD